MYFEVDDDGFISLNEVNYEVQKANNPTILFELVLSLEQFLTAMAVVHDLASTIDWYEDYEAEGVEYAELLKEEAKTGTLSFGSISTG